ncbi:hypothetical protein [Celeribacter naphthalenivorans]|uniref:hypothetical protein n=1 Tax=Celeribacter naphthalenivorans TaxID=1614694 RepID=UPI001CFA38B4|nr:hypothetical protein [Celeribacter naphthalenivorans]
MPAYRSEAEAAIREPVVARLRELMPSARIIHEIQCATWGPNRIDVLAVTRNRIAAVEIKSSKDKLDRLPKQISSMNGCAHHVIAALHSKFFSVKDTPNAGTWISAPKEARACQVWGFDLPDAHGADQYREHELSSRWDKPMVCPPDGAIDMLWRQELREIASRRKLHTATSRLTIPELIDVIKWNMNWREITEEVCAALRARDCIEADPPIINGVA